MLLPRSGQFAVSGHGLKIVSPAFFSLAYFKVLPPIFARLESIYAWIASNHCRTYPLKRQKAVGLRVCHWGQGALVMGTSGRQKAVRRCNSIEGEETGRKRWAHTEKKGNKNRLRADGIACRADSPVLLPPPRSRRQSGSPPQSAEQRCSSAGGTCGTCLLL